MTACDADPGNVVGGAPSHTMTARTGQHLNCSGYFPQPSVLAGLASQIVCLRVNDERRTPAVEFVQDCLRRRVADP
jgi:hypothetical protein